MLTQAERAFFAHEQALHEAKYLAGTDPRLQSGFGGTVGDWERFRRPVAAPIDRDISAKLVELARRRLPHWHDRIFTGNALLWEPPARFDFVRTELVYVPSTRRREYAERLLEWFLASGGRLIICSYGSSRPEGDRAEPLVDEIGAWGLPIDRVEDVVCPEHGFVITRVISVSQSALRTPSMPRSG